MIKATFKYMVLPLALGAQSVALAQDTRFFDNEQHGRIERQVLERVVIVNATALNFRADPSVSQPPIGVMRQAEPALVLAETFNSLESRRWTQIRRRDGTEGWVAREFLEPIQSTLSTLDGAMELLSGLQITTLADFDTSPTIAVSNARQLEEIHAGFVFSAPIGDAGWTFSHNVGRLAIEALPFVSETSHVESIPEDAALIAEAIDELIAGGANLIFGTSFGYMDAMVEAARLHPDIVFMHSSGFKTADNLATYFGRIYQARYLSGIVAGAATQTDRIGFVGAFPIAELVRGINAFTLGAQTVNPDVEVEVTWTGTWYGPGIESEAADALIANGVDVVTMHQNSPAVVQAAEQAGIMAVGFHTDMSLFAPNAALTSAMWDWTPIYTKAVTDLHEGIWQADQQWWGIDEGAVKLAPLSKSLPADLAASVEATTQALAAGEFRIFEGPIRGQSGDIAVPSGTILSDAELLQMDFFVRGVNGTLPEPTAPAGADN